MGGSKGTIKQLKGSGFGFVRPHTGQVDGSDLYFHAKECHKDSPFDDMHADDEVTYSAERDDRNGKWMAVQVKLVWWFEEEIKERFSLPWPLRLEASAPIATLGIISGEPHACLPFLLKAL